MGPWKRLRALDARVTDWLRRFPSNLFAGLDGGPSFEELATANRAAAHRWSPVDARAELERRLPQYVGATRAEALLARVGEPDAAWFAAFGEALTEAGYPRRPGTVEELWFVEGLYQRARETAG